MFGKKKKSFFERLTGSNHFEDEEFEIEENKKGSIVKNIPVKSADKKTKDSSNWIEEEESVGELTVDVYQTPTEIVLQTMVAGVRPDDLQVSITRDMVTIKGKREENRNISEENYFVKELYWGSFARTILLPQEVEPEEAEAIEKHGLLIIKLPKIDKEKKTNLRIKSI